MRSLTFRSSKLEIERIMSIIALVCQFAFYTFPAEALTVEVILSDKAMLRNSIQVLVIFAV